MPPLIPYNRSYSFIPAPIPGVRINIELDNVGLSLNGAINAIKDVRRDDGALKNEVVTLDSLSPQVRAGIGAGALEARDAAQAAQAIAEDARDDAVGSAAAAATSAVHATSALEGAQLAQEQAAAASVGAQTARDFAAQWSSAAFGVDVNDGVNPVNKSAYHWAQVALAAAAGSIADGSITTAKLADGALSADATGRAKMADGFVTSAKIADGTIATVDLADGMLSADTTGRAKMADGFVTSAKIADGTVANVDLANMAQATVKGRASGAGTGVPSDLDAAAIFAILGGLVPAKPQTAAGAGQIVLINTPAGNGYSLPTGGTWLAVWFGINNQGQVNYGVNTAVAAGGTAIQPGASGISFTGFAWRIA